MNPAGIITPRLFSPFPVRDTKLTADNLPSQKIETPQVHRTSNYVIPAPDKEILMATAVASWAPVMARSYIEQEKRESEISSPDYTLAA